MSAAAAPEHGHSKWAVAVTVMVPTAMEILDTSVANVALPHIQGSMNADIDEVTWVLTSYLVANAIVLPMTGWLAGSFGRKRFLATCVLGFTAASFLCGSSTTLVELIFFRILQGFFGGALQPMSQAILLETFPREEHGQAMAFYGMGVVAAPIFGPILGGYITDELSWRWIFYINLPIGILSALAIFTVIHDPPYLTALKRKADLLGIGFLVVGVAALQIMLDKGNQENWFSSHFIIGCAIVAAAAIAGLLWWELLGASAPLVDLRLFARRSFSVGCFIMFLTYFAFFSSIVLLPLYLQTLMGYTAFDAGLVLGPGGIATIFALPIVGRLVARGHARTLLMIGLSVSALAVHLMSRFNMQADFWHIIQPRIIQGVGLSCFFVPLTTLTMSQVPREQTSNATGLYSLVRNLGGSIGVSIATTILARREQFHQARIADVLGAIDTQVQEGISQLAALLAAQGVPIAAARDAAIQVLYREVLQQSSMLSFNDSFQVLFVCLLVIVPLVLLFRRPARGGAPDAAAVH